MSTDHAAKIRKHIEAFNLLFHPDSINGFDEAALSHLDTIQQHADALQTERAAERARVARWERAFADLAACYRSATSDVAENTIEDILHTWIRSNGDLPDEDGERT